MLVINLTCVTFYRRSTHQCL